MKVESAKLIPTRTHYAALVFKTQTIWHEGDERSKSCPGHGYPEYTEHINTIEYHAFNDKVEMEKWVIGVETEQYKYTNKPVYKIIESTPCDVKIQSTVTIAK